MVGRPKIRLIMATVNLSMTTRDSSSFSYSGCLRRFSMKSFNFMATHCSSPFSRTDFLILGFLGS